METEETTTSLSSKTDEDSVTTEDSDVTGTTKDTEDKMAEEEKSITDYSDTMEDIDELEDIQKLIVSELVPTEIEEKAKHGKSVNGKQHVTEYNADEELEEERIREKLVLKEKEEQLLSKEEELKREEERRDKMKVLLSGYLELKTKKEIEKALLNEKKIIAQWLYPFRASYQKDWQLEMTKLKLAFQKALDYKKAHIHAIQRERKLCELNHLWADCAHYQISEELFDFMRKRCEKLKKNYLEELEETKRYYLEREQQILDKCEKADERAKHLIHLRKSIHENILKQTKEALERYKNKGEYLKEKEKEIIERKHVIYVEQIAQELQTSISPPESRMEEIRGIFEEWKNKYETFTQIFAKNKKEMQIVADEIPTLEKRVEAAKKRLDDVKKETKRYQRVRMEELSRLEADSKNCDGIKPTLRKMVSDSEEVMVQLRERKTQLDKIVKLKKLCDQLEAESDRANEDIADLGEVGKKDTDCLSFIRDLCSEEIEDPNLLENLHRKVSRVKFQNQILKHDVEKLKTENMALKSDMKKYLEKISSEEWAKLPEELQFDVDQRAAGKNNRKDRKMDANEKFRENLELLRRKCRPINSRIGKSLEQNFD